MWALRLWRQVSPLLGTTSFLLDRQINLQSTITHKSELHLKTKPFLFFLQLIAFTSLSFWFNFVNIRPYRDRGWLVYNLSLHIYYRIISFLIFICLQCDTTLKVWTFCVCVCVDIVLYNVNSTISTELPLICIKFYVRYFFPKLFFCRLPISSWASAVALPSGFSQSNGSDCSQKWYRSCCPCQWLTDWFSDLLQSCLQIRWQTNLSYISYCANQKQISSAQ